VERESTPCFFAEPGASASGGDVLAGESSAKDIDFWRVGDGRDIGEPLHVGEVVGEHTGTERIDLTLPSDARR
jgi:hypothetical protein